MHQDDGAAADVLQFAHVTSSQQDIYQGDDEDDDDESIFASTRCSTLISKSERQKLVERDQQFFRDLFKGARNCLDQIGSQIGSQKMVSLDLGSVPEV